MHPHTHAKVLAQVDRHCESLFFNVAVEIKKRKLGTFHAQELSNLVWGYSTVGEKDGQLLELIEEEAVRRGLQEFKSQVQFDSNARLLDFANLSRMCQVRRRCFTILMLPLDYSDAAA